MSNQQHYNSRYSSIGEEENDYQLSNLHNQVSTLKSVYNSMIINF